MRRFPTGDLPYLVALVFAFLAAQGYVIRWVLSDVHMLYVALHAAADAAATPSDGRRRSLQRHTCCQRPSAEAVRTLASTRRIAMHACNQRTAHRIDAPVCTASSAAVIVACVQRGWQCCPWDDLRMSTLYVVACCMSLHVACCAQSGERRCPGGGACRGRAVRRKQVEVPSPALMRDARHPRRLPRG